MNFQGIQNPLRFSALRYPALGLCLFGLAACVSQVDYDNAQALARHYQTVLHEREQDIEKLKVELEQRQRAAAMNDVSSLSDASFGDIDSRISELQQKIDGLGRPLKDIERFDVDGGYVVLVQDKILFDSGSANLSAAGQTALDKVAAEIGAQPHGRVWVRGHTDSDRVSKPATKEKFPHGNLQLSAARAIEVAAQLIAAGKVPEKDVVVAGFGPHDPIRPNDNPDNKRLNRRVEIFVSDRTAPTPASAAKGPG